MTRATYLAPGVYVEEVPAQQKSIAGVGTNTVAFIGVVPEEIKYPKPPEEGGTEHEDEIRRLNSDIQKLETDKRQTTQKLDKINQDLGQPDLKDNAKRSLERQKAGLETEQEQTNNQIVAKTQRVAELQAAPASEAKPYLLESFTVEVKPGQAKLCTNFTEYTKRFGPFSADDPAKEPGVPLYPGHRWLTHAVYGFFLNGGTKAYVVRVGSDNAAEIDRALESLSSIDAVAIIAAPGLSGKAIWGSLVAHCDNLQDRFAILDCPADVGTDGELNVQLLQYETANHVLPGPAKNAAYYFPWLQVMDPAKQLQDQDPARNVPLKHRGKVHVPATGHIAGIYARTDTERGVHKAPANAAVQGALNVKYYIGRPRHEELNPQGVNVIRNINGNINVWGARTIGGDKNAEWKYVNVRRLFLFLRESINEGTQWVVFEPNDQALWGRIRRNVTAFLTNVWRSGALFGSTPEEAFYVKCDEETNPPEVRDVGQVVTEIGVAIVRPAEFVIFRISQSSGQHRT